MRRDKHSFHFPVVWVLILQALSLMNQAVAADPIGVSLEHDWPWWRGPTHDGIAAPDQNPPTSWNGTKNILWKAEVPGRGHGSPTVVGDRVFLQTADESAKVQSVLCYSRKSGKLIWRTDVHKGKFAPKLNKRATHASSSVACDGRRIYANFMNDGAVYTTALDLEGNKTWQRKISEYVIHQGYGSSPFIYGSLLLVSADNKTGGALAALERATGNVVWKLDRPEKPNYVSPTVLRVAGKEQLFLYGCDLVTGVDPLTGKKLWEVEGATTECVTSPVTDGKLVFTSGGYPDNHVSGVQADGSGKVAWRNSVRVYVPSMICTGGNLYAVTDSGIAMCWESSTGKTRWKGRLGGTFSSSPILVGENLYATNGAGKTFVFKADPEKFQLVTTNQVGEEVFATPAICGGRIYMRVAAGRGDERREYLYCIGSR